MMPTSGWLMPAVMPLSSTDSRAISSASRSISSPSRRRTRARSDGRQARQAGYAAWAALHRGVDVVWPGKRDGALDLASRRIHVVVHASRTTRTCLAADVQVHFGNGQVNAHRVVLRLDVTRSKIHDLLIRHLTS